MRHFKIFFFAAAFFILLSGATALHAQSGITGIDGRRVTCASDDGGRHLCRVDTSRGVRLLNQRSGSPCVQGRTWGFNPRGIWVDRGCRADFVLGRMHGGPGWGGPGPGMPPPVGPPGRMLTCSSNDGRRKYCPADTFRGVQLVNQRSGSPCVQGRTWGYDRRGVWVDRGCRADFALGR